MTDEDLDLGCQRAIVDPDELFIEIDRLGLEDIEVRGLEWIRILYRCWKEQIPYDEVHYISVLKRRGSGLVKIVFEHPDAIRRNGTLKSQFLS